MRSQYSGLKRDKQLVGIATDRTTTNTLVERRETTKTKLRKHEKLQNVQAKEEKESRMALHKQQREQTRRKEVEFMAHKQAEKKR